MARPAIALFSSIILSLICFQAFALELESLTEIEPYQLDSKEFSCANQSRDEWKVTLENGKVQVSKFVPSSSVKLDIAGGSLVGHDKGEWGGELEFVKGKKSQKVFKDHISSLFPLPDMRVVAFGGLAHETSDEGHMLIIKKASETSDWKIEKQVKLPAHPYAVAVRDANSFYFVTGEGLYSIDWKSGKFENLKATPTKGLYPNSLVATEKGHIYIGMRHAVAHFIPEKKSFQVKWLVQKRCTDIK